MLELDRTYCTDCLDGMKQIEDCSVDFVLTDPPFNVSLDYRGYDDSIHNERYSNWCKEWISGLYRVLKDRRYCIIFTGDKNLYWVMKSIYNTPFVFHHFMKWYKPGCQRALSGTVFFNRLELAFLVSKKKPDLQTINRKVLYEDLLEYKNTSSSDTDAVDHNARRPVPLYERLINGFTSEGWLVLDPFIGSGTTAVACKKLKRHFIGFEICQEYCDIANKRLADTHVTKSLFSEES